MSASVLGEDVSILDLLEKGSQWWTQLHQRLKIKVPSQVTAKGHSNLSLPCSPVELNLAESPVQHGRQERCGLEQSCGCLHRPICGLSSFYSTMKVGSQRETSHRAALRKAGSCSVLLGSATCTVEVPAGCVYLKAGTVEDCRHPGMGAREGGCRDSPTFPTSSRL